MANQKVTLTSEELRIVLTAASIWFAMAEDPKDPEMVEMTKRGQAILHKICSIADDNKTFDLLVR